MRYYIRTKLIIQQITKKIQIVKGQIKKLIFTKFDWETKYILIPKFFSWIIRF